MIYIIDTIGEHSGMRYFNESYQKLFGQLSIKSVVISNYSGKDSLPLFYNFYRGNLFQKLLLLLISYLRYLFFMMFNWKKNIFIYHSYGLRWIDWMFVFPFGLSKRFFVEVHDVYSIHRKLKLKRIKNAFYMTMINRVIIHSEATKSVLKNIGFKREMLYVPHFKYNFDKNYSDQNISAEVRSLICEQKINFLFFGIVRESKGLDILVAAISRLPQNLTGKINIIVAGKDGEGIIDKLRLNHLNHGLYKILNRHIESEELNFLFENSNYALLPYKEIYQSGVLEMAIYFRLPVLTSDLKIFKDVLGKHKTFGSTFSLSKPDDLEVLIKKVIDTHGVSKYYSENDILSYYEEEESMNFLKEFIKMNHL